MGLKNKYVRDAFVWTVKQGGSLTTDEHGKARIEFCKARRSGKPCEYYGTVNPAGIEFEGCTKCGCPFATKAFMLELKVPVHKKVTCPHPDGNFWEEVDSKFKNSDS